MDRFYWDPYEEEPYFSDPPSCTFTLSAVPGPNTSRLFNCPITLHGVVPHTIISITRILQPFSDEGVFLLP